ncbi:MAG: PDZ domain-containing protein, partial [Acidobacteria bacterium]
MGAVDERSLVRRLVDRVPAQSASRWDAAIHGFLVLFCLFAPHSIALTQGAFYAAFALWLMKIMWRRQWPRRSSRLDVPIGLFVGLTVLSSVFSYEPAVSLEKLGSVSLVLIFFLVVHHVRSLGWAKLLVLMMVASCLINVGYVFWEKARGRGLQIVQLSPTSPLAEAGLRPGDVILEVDGQVVNSLAELRQRSAGKRHVNLFVYRPEIYFRRTLSVGSWKTTSDLGVRVRRWHRFRAAGFYGWNYFTYAEVLQLLAAVAFGLLLEVQRKRSWLFVLLVIVVMAMGEAIILTVTR